MKPKQTRSPMENGTVILRRTFNQSDFKGGMIKYWRVMSQWHKCANSDLSIEGLKEWGIIR